MSVWACGACGIVHHTKEEALKCCAPNFCKCGLRLKERYLTQCASCQKKHLAEQDQALYDKAKKVPWSEYCKANEWLYCDDDRYFGSLDELLDHYYDEFIDPEDMPTWAWGTTEQRPSFSAQEMMYAEFENGEYPEDYYDQVDDKDLKAMQDVLDKMAKDMQPYYYADHSVVVEFDQELEEYLKRRKERSI